MSKPNPICVALDAQELAPTLALARALKPHVGWIKIGMEFFYAQGPKGYEALAAEGVPVFLDLKLHDIPNTVAQALTSLLKLTPQPAILNVHASGGLAMLEKARAAVGAQAKLIAVTVLTSLSDQDIWQAGFNPARSTAELAVKMARLTEQAGLDGVVCSPLDLPHIRQATKPGFLTIVPGIRLAEGEAHDQKRIATPQAAVKAGADILVIGRAITGSANPAAAAQAIHASLSKQA